MELPTKLYRQYTPIYFIKLKKNTANIIATINAR
jgi:hypothetical protein